MSQSKGQAPAKIEESAQQSEDCSQKQEHPAQFAERLHGGYFRRKWSKEVTKRDGSRLPKAVSSIHARRKNSQSRTRRCPRHLNRPCICCQCSCLDLGESIRGRLFC